jgi:YhcH/YjgK/YiaL family protein
VVKGKEKIGVAAVSSATVIKPYDDAKDIANYTADGKFYIATPDEFFLFFPSDAHRPSIKVNGYDTVKKLVIKIRYTPVQ